MHQDAVRSAESREGWLPLSKELSDVLLEHEHFGSHLDDRGNTIDPRLELNNFEHAGKILGEIWSGMVIDGHRVIAEDIADEASEVVKDISEKWKSSHVRSSQYLLQIVKCGDIVCCMPFRSSYRKIVKDRFLPPPFSICQSPDDGLTWTRSYTGHYLLLHQTIVMGGMIPASAHRKYPLGIPYDAFNPAVKDDLKKRMCAQCGMYFCTVKAMPVHRRSCSDDNDAKSEEASDSCVATERVRPLRIAAIRQREALCVMQMQEMEWMSLDDIAYDDLECISVVTDPEVGTPLFNPFI